MSASKLRKVILETCDPTGAPRPDATAVYDGIVSQERVTNPTVRGLVDACEATGAHISLLPIGSPRRPEGTSATQLVAEVDGREKARKFRTLSKTVPGIKATALTLA